MLMINTYPIFFRSSQWRIGLLNAPAPGRGRYTRYRDAMMRLIDALTRLPGTPIFAVLDSDSDDPSAWRVVAVEAPVLSESDESNFFIVQAKHILADGTAEACYIDVCLPERISDYAYTLGSGRVLFDYHRHFEGEIICAVPIDCFGVYDLFYSRTAPDIGIDILRRGLAVAARKTFIAADLGYILRDERRFAEAAEMFELVVAADATPYFIYAELARCYEELGQLDKAATYRSYRASYRNRS